MFSIIKVVLNSVTTSKLLSLPAPRPHFPQTVSVLEERLTLTEDKLKECLLHQSQILKDVRVSGEWRRTESEETDGSADHFT